MSHDPTLVVLCGMPCAGKSTFARLFPCDDVVAWDDVGERHGDATEAIFWRTIDRRCRLRVSTIVDATNLLPAERDRCRLAAFGCGLPCSLIFFSLSLDTAMARNQTRPDPISDAVMTACYRKAVLAYGQIRDEGFDSVYIIRSPSQES